MKDKKKILLIYPPSFKNRFFYYSIGIPYGLIIIRSYLMNKNIESDIIYSKQPLIKFIIRGLNFMRIPGNPFFIKIINMLQISKKIKVRYKSLGNILPKLIRESELITMWESKILDAINKNDYKIIGFSIATMEQLKNSINAAKIIKKRKNLKIVFGGPFITKNHEYLAKHNLGKIIDYLVMGDGEHTLYEIIKNIDKSSMSNVANIYYSKNGFLKRNVDNTVKNEFIIPLYENKGGTILLRLSKGCPWAKCRFCTYEVLEGKHNTLSIKKSVEMVKELKRRNNPKKIIFIDDTFTPEFLKEFCEALIDENIKINWECFGLNLDINFAKGELAKKMKQAGCSYVKFGLESPIPRLIKVLKKQHSKSSAIQVLKVFKRENIKVGLNMQVGIPSQTKQDILDTIYFLKKYQHFYSYVILHHFSLEDKTIFKKYHERFGIQKVYDDDKGDGTPRFGFEFESSNTFTYDETEDMIQMIENSLPKKVANSFFSSFIYS